jgi:hypothetical protein
LREVGLASLFKVRHYEFSSGGRILRSTTFHP